MAAVDAFCVSVFGFLPSARHRWPPFLVKICLPWQRKLLCWQKFAQITQDAHSLKINRQELIWTQQKKS